MGSPRESLAASGLRIRRIAPSDAPSLFRAVRSSLEELIPYMPWCTREYALHESVTWLAARWAAWEGGEDYTFAIEDALGGPLLGTVGLSRFDMLNRRANLGYWVRTDATSRGIATTAARLCAEFGLQDLALRRVEILVAVENVASLAVAQNTGAQHEGVLRGRLLLGGRAHDAAIFSLVPGDRIPGLGVIKPREAPPTR
jgi:RimJ/RimL family protein N-acetyltransferase